MLIEVKRIPKRKSSYFLLSSIAFSSIQHTIFIRYSTWSKRMCVCVGMWPPVWNDYVSTSFWNFVVLSVIFHFTWCHTNACFISIVRLEKDFIQENLLSLIVISFLLPSSSYKIFVLEQCHHWELCVCVCFYFFSFNKIPEMFSH